jgi:hypothetical protein
VRRCPSMAQATILPPESLAGLMGTRNNSD